MSKSTRKIVAGLLSFAMVLTLVVGLSVAPASAQTVSTVFTTNLTVGSRGADVTRLQTILNAGGYLMVAPTGYFGSLTRAAVAAWQQSAGVPSTGYFGPLSRAAIAMGSTPTPTPNPVAGCMPGYVYNVLTGARCDTSTPTPSGAEGTLTVSSAASVSSQSNIQSNSDVTVYGLDLRAQLGDVKVDRLDLKVAVTNTGDSSIENPGNFINTVKVWDGSTLLKTWSVGTANFIDGSTANTYYIRLSGLGLVVPKDTTRTLKVSFSTNAGIDNTRSVVVSGYGTNSLLTVSGNNITSYYDVSAISRTHTFVKPGSATLTVQSDASNPLAQTIKINKSSSGTTLVTMQTFGVKSESGDAKVTSLVATSTASGVTGPTALYLYDGSTVLGQASLTAASGEQAVTFNSFPGGGVVVPSGTTKVLTLVGEFQNSTTDGTWATTSVKTVTYQKSNGSSASAATTVQGNQQYIYSVSPNWTLLSTTISNDGVINNQPSGVSATFVLKAKPQGGTMTYPLVNDFVLNVASSASSVRLGAASSVDVAGISSAQSLYEGSEYTVTVRTGVASTSLTSGNYDVWFTISGATSTIGSTTTTQTWGLGGFKTGATRWNE